jgi:hypothetical protein
MKDCAGRLKSPKVIAGLVVYCMQYARHRADENFSVCNNRLHTGHQAFIDK